MLKPEILKMIMAVAGVRDLSVKFNSKDEVVEATFKRSGKACTEQIPFSDIEAAFSSTGQIKDPPASSGRRPGSSGAAYLAGGAG